MEGGPGGLSFVRRTGEGIRLRVRLTPKAARDGIDGPVALPGPEGHALGLRLRARPVEGEANAALLQFLAGALGVPRSAVSLETGAAGRVKTVSVRGEAAALEAALTALLVEART